MNRVVLAGLIAALLAAGYMLYTDRPLETGRGAYVSLYDHPSSGLAAALATGDGQSYAALARDPTMSRPQVFQDGPDEAAYRYQRPVLGYLAWIGSFGRPDWEPDAQAVWVVLGAAAATAACAEILRRRTLMPYLALCVLVTPGMLSAISGLTAEPIALAFVTLGLLAWWGPRRRAVVTAVFMTLAALTRESSLVALVPLGVVELVGSHRAAFAVRVRRLTPLLVPFAAYASWLVIVRIRVHAWPVAGRAVRLSAVPFGAFVHDVPRFVQPATTWLWFVVGALLVAWIVVRGRRDPLSPIVVAYAVFAAFFGTDVWRRWQDFGRPLLPLYAYGIVAFLTWVQEAPKRSKQTM